MREKRERTIDRDFTARQAAAAKLGELWCAFMHDSLAWPVGNQYQCRTCGRYYPVPWAAGKVPPATPVVVERAPIRQGHVPSLRSALLPLVIMLALLPEATVNAANVPAGESTPPAAMAFARYTAGLEQASPWNLETVEIDASLPKLEKHGRLRAIRRLLPFGRLEYQVLEISGDQTVKQQVIVRYLSAEMRAAAVPASAVAITPANYKFRYKGSVRYGDTVAYAFQIAPRGKREGLIKGELWLDETGAAVRQSGYMVKKPSIFVKRVDVTRETSLRDGMVEEKVTHVSVETRLVGRAELTIHEHPYSAPDHSPALSIAER